MHRQDAYAAVTRRHAQNSTIRPATAALTLRVRAFTLYKPGRHRATDMAGIVGSGSRAMVRLDGTQWFVPVLSSSGSERIHLNHHWSVQPARYGIALECSGGMIVGIVAF